MSFNRNFATLIDIALSDTGDILLSASGDLEIVTGMEAFLQQVNFRLRTKEGDCDFWPECGASLDLLIGKPLSPKTVTAAEVLITKSLTHDGFIPVASVSVTGDPQIESNTLNLLIEIDLSGRFIAETLPEEGSILTLSVVFDMQQGLLV